jgi:hypothetical protein
MEGRKHEFSAKTGWQHLSYINPSTIHQRKSVQNVQIIQLPSLLYVSLEEKFKATRKIECKILIK